MINLDPKKQNIIYISVSVIISLAIFFFVIRPSVMEIIKIRQEITEENQKLESKFQNIKYLQKNKDKVKDIENKVSILDEFVIGKNQELDFINFLDNLAVSNNIKNPDINLTTPPPTVTTNKQTQKKDEAIYFEIKAVGPNENIIKYLTSIEQSNYYINFDSVQMIAKPTNDKFSNNQAPKDPDVEIILKGKIFLSLF